MAKSGDIRAGGAYVEISTKQDKFTRGLKDAERQGDQFVARANKSFAKLATGTNVLSVLRKDGAALLSKLGPVSTAFAAVASAGGVVATAYKAGADSIRDAAKEAEKAGVSVEQWTGGAISTRQVEMIALQDSAVRGLADAYEELGRSIAEEVSPALTRAATATSLLLDKLNEKLDGNEGTVGAFLLGLLSGPLAAAAQTPQAKEFFDELDAEARRKQDEQKRLAAEQERLREEKKDREKETERIFREQRAASDKADDRAESLKEQSRTPAEKLRDQLREVDDLRESGRLNQDEAAKAKRFLFDQAAKAFDKDKKTQTTAGTFNATAAARLQGGGAGIEAETLQVNRDQLRVLRQIYDANREGGIGVN